MKKHVGVGSNKMRNKLGRRFDEALRFASKKHGRQTRKGTDVPYIAHLLGVASLVLEAGGDEDMAIAALLHDVVEDCGGAPMLEEIRRRFGRRVAHIWTAALMPIRGPSHPGENAKSGI